MVFFSISAKVTQRRGHCSTTENGLNMRHLLSTVAKGVQFFSEPLDLRDHLHCIDNVVHRGRFALLAACILIAFASSGVSAELQLQRLYTANSLPPPSFLLQGHDGNFYGTMVSRPSGRIFKMTPDGAVTVFPLLAGVNADLALADDGDIYGTFNNELSGSATNGGIFVITPSGQVSNVFLFKGTNGPGPQGMRKGIDGCFYGIMSRTNRSFGLPPPMVTNETRIFQFTTNHTVTELYAVTNGADFTGLPVQGPDGYLYGTTLARGGLIQPPLQSAYILSIYRLSTNGDFQIIHAHSNAPAGAGDLIFGADGSLYGTTGGGHLTFPPVTFFGSVFRVTTNGNYSTLFMFGSTNGASPGDRLLQANDGYFYGTTFNGGISDSGTIFRISVHGEFTSLLDFTGSNGSNPLAPLIQASDGNFYGTTLGSIKPSGPGTIFRLVQSTAISNFGISNGTATLTWNSFPNGIYRVEYKSALSDLSWVPLIQRVTATDQTITVFDNAATDPQRSYRVVLLP
jgi:uncharacterized repeat protein (TIGR03803 family)